MASLKAQLIKNLPAICDTPFDSWVRKIHWRRDSLLTTVFLGFPAGSAGKESACNARDLGLIPGLGRSLGWEDPLEKGKATHSSILAWRIPWTIQSIGSQRVRLSNFHFHTEGYLRNWKAASPGERTDSSLQSRRRRKTSLNTFKILNHVSKSHF